MWLGFVAESGRQSDTCVLLRFVSVWYVCVYMCAYAMWRSLVCVWLLFLAKCSLGLIQLY